MTETKTGTQSKNGRPGLTPQRRTEIFAVLRHRGEALAEKHGIKVAEIEPTQGGSEDELFLLGLTVSLLKKRRPALLHAAFDDLEDILAATPQKTGSRAFHRVHDLLRRLLFAGAKRDGLL